MSEKKRRYSIFDVRNEPMEKFEKLVERIIAYEFSESPSWDSENCCLKALSNVLITPQEVIVTADLPNIEPETVRVKEVDEGTIQISAKMKEKVRFKDLGIYHRQGEFSYLSCQDRINVAFNTEKMKISWKGGILEARFPRKKKH
jgi:HSP20 family molecular chaperone IbpA